MAEVNAKDLTTKTAPASTDSMLLFGTSTNEGAKITVDNLANNILERLTTKTFANQVGGSSAATILAQLATLNSNIAVETAEISITLGGITGYGRVIAMGKIVVLNVSITGSDLFLNATGNDIIGQLPSAYTPVAGKPNVVSIRTSGTWNSASYKTAHLSCDTGGALYLRANTTDIRACNQLTGSLVYIRS